MGRFVVSMSILKYIKIDHPKRIIWISDVKKLFVADVLHQTATRNDHSTQEWQLASAVTHRKHHYFPDCSWVFGRCAIGTMNLV